MELPKHTTQVGTIAANKKLYLEDYCISYMKQLTEEFPDDRKQIALFGIVEREKTTEYAFAYGAALLGRGKGRTDSMTNSQKDEAESIREEFFSDYQLIGIVISMDAVNENIFWLGNGNKSIPMDGYYIFYDSNEAMLNYMMENNKEERDIDLDPVIVKKADMDREKQEKATREKMEAAQKGGKYRRAIQQGRRETGSEKAKSKRVFPAAACLLLLGIGGVYGLKTYYPEFGPEQVKGYVEELRGKTSMFVSNYLGDDQNRLLAENDTTENFAAETESVPSEAAEPEDIVIVEAELESPAKLDVIVIPEPEVLENPVLSQEIQTQLENTESSEPENITTENTPIETEPVQSESVVQKYLIKKGDNLLKILRFYYGDEAKLLEICELNDIKDPNNIQVGQTILLP